MFAHLALTDHLNPSKGVDVSNNSTPMDYGEAVWRTAEIRMMLNDQKAKLDAMPPFARHFALEALIKDVEEAIKHMDPEFTGPVLRMYRGWRKM